MSKYLGAFEVEDGYCGSRAVVHLCAIGDTLYAVLPFGFYVESWARFV